MNIRVRHQIRPSYRECESGVARYHERVNRGRGHLRGRHVRDRGRHVRDRAHDLFRRLVNPCAHAERLILFTV